MMTQLEEPKAQRAYQVTPEHLRTQWVSRNSLLVKLSPAQKAEILRLEKAIAPADEAVVVADDANEAAIKACDAQEKRLATLKRDGDPDNTKEMAELAKLSLIVPLLPNKLAVVEKRLSEAQSVAGRARHSLGEAVKAPVEVALGAERHRLAELLAPLFVGLGDPTFVPELVEKVDSVRGLKTLLASDLFNPQNRSVTMGKLLAGEPLDF